jgi:hypothetical protein
VKKQPAFEPDGGLLHTTFLLSAVVSFFRTQGADKTEDEEGQDYEPTKGEENPAGQSHC